MIETAICRSCALDIHLDGGVWVHSDDYAHCYANGSDTMASPLITGQPVFDDGKTKVFLLPASTARAGRLP